MTTETEATPTRDLKSMDDIIIAENVDKWFGDFQALDNISMRIKEHEIVVVLGPSGSGKSTFIRCLNRLEEHDAGRIVIDGIEMNDDVRNLNAIRSEAFMIVPKMDFLFWGWFKALIQYSLYNAIAMIMLNIWCTVITRYATSMGNLDVSFQSLALLTGTWMVPVAAVLVCAIASIMKVGDIAGMIVGAGSDGGGIIGGAFMAGRIVAAPARVAAAPLKGGVPA